MEGRPGEWRTGTPLLGPEQVGTYTQYNSIRGMQPDDEVSAELTSHSDVAALTLGRRRSHTRSHRLEHT